MSIYDQWQRRCDDALSAMHAVMLERDEAKAKIQQAVDLCNSSKDSVSKELILMALSEVFNKAEEPVKT